MAFTPQPHNWINGTAGLLLGSLGIWAATVRPRRLSNVAFGLFLALFGVGFFVNHLFTVWEGHDGWAFTAAGLLWGLACVALIVATLQFPLPLPRRLWKWAVAAAVGCLATMVVIVPRVWERAASEPIQPSNLVLTHQLGNVAFTSMVILCFGAAAVMAVRFAAEKDAWQKRRIGLVGLALGIYLGSVTGTGPFTMTTSPLDVGPLAQASTIVDFSWTAVLVTLWLFATRSPSESRLARNVALAHLLFATAGLLLVSTELHLWGLERAWHGLARLVAFAIVGYAILKGRLLDIDRPARIVVKSSVLFAGAAVLFAIVAQIAENLLNEEFGLLVGSIATAAVLVAIAPLQHMTRRVAHTAIPRPSAGESESLSIYREQVVLAWRDGTMTAKERHLLDRLRSSLRLNADEAHAAERDVLAEPHERKARRT